MGTEPRVTIVMATWNWCEVLPYSIGSVLLQTFGDFELLVVGDGCTDASEDVVAAIGDPRIRWVNLSRNHGHQSGPNNEGIRQARGELIAYLGHDDLWLPDHLGCLVKAIDSGADLAHSIVRVVTPGDEEGCVMRPDYRPGDWLPPTGVVHRVALVREAGGWPDYRHPYLRSGNGAVAAFPRRGSPDMLRAATDCREVSGFGSPKRLSGAPMP